MQNFNLLIVNDCSTDGSVAIIEQFFTENPRQYELISFKENGGIAHARNFAITHVDTRYFLFVDSDDILDKHIVEKQYCLITSNKYLMGVSCWSRYINEKGEILNGGTFLGERNEKDFIEKASKKKLIFLPIHTMFDRDIAIKAGNICIKGFPTGKPRMQDFCEELDMWTRMSDFYKDGKAIVTIPEVLYYYRKGSGLSSNSFNMIIKMRYTKANLLRRRNSEKELTFIEFKDSLSPDELKKMEKDAMAADALRQGYYALKKGRIFTFIGKIATSICNNPGYIVDKFKHNVLRRK